MKKNVNATNIQPIISNEAPLASRPIYKCPMPLKPIIPAIKAIATAVLLLLVWVAIATALALFWGFPQEGQNDALSEGRSPPQFLQKTIHLILLLINIKTLSTKSLCHMRELEITYWTTGHVRKP